MSRTTAARPPALLDSVTIVGNQAAARQTGGSAHYIGEQELERFDYSDILPRAAQRARRLRIQDEEGYGLRPNIGIRGSGT